MGGGRGERARGLGGQDSCRVVAIARVGCDHGGAAVRRVVVQRGQAAQHARRLAVPDKIVAAFVQQLAQRELHQLFGQHRVRQAAGDLERRQQRRRCAHVVREPGAHGLSAPSALRSVRLVRQAAARPVGATDDALELVDGSGHQILRIAQVCGAQTCVDRRRGLGYTRHRRPVSAKAADQLADRGKDPLVVGERGHFDKQREPGGTADDSRFGRRGRKGLRERTAESVAEVLAVGTEVLTQQEGERSGLDRADSTSGAVSMVRRVGVIAQERRVDARGDCLQLRNPGCLQGANYNERMILVRFATLVALVLWLSALINERFGNLFWRVDTISYGCGIVTVVGLFVMKFMGPPPPAFVPRAAIASVMLLVAFASTLPAAGGFITTLIAVNIGLGLVLLCWYVRE